MNVHLRGLQSVTHWAFSRAALASGGSVWCAVVAACCAQHNMMCKADVTQHMTDSYAVCIGLGCAMAYALLQALSYLHHAGIASVQVFDMVSVQHIRL